MRSEPEDRMYHEEDRRKSPAAIVLAAVAIIAIIAVITFYDFPGGQSESPVTVEPDPTLSTAPEPPPVPVMPPAPDIPVPVPAPLPVPASAPEELPEEIPIEPEVSFENSDQDLRDTLSAAGESPLISQFLLADDLVQRSAGMIDGFSRGLVPRKILPLAPPKKKFSTLKIDGRTYMDPAGYARYDSYARAIAALDLDLLVATFHRYRALIEYAYAELGYSAEEADNAMIRSLDYVLATPEVSEPVAVKTKEAVFVYTDPELEQLSPVQKLLLRMGPDNAARIKQQAAALRARLLGESG